MCCPLEGVVLREFAKFRAFRACVPYVAMGLMCLRAFLPQITTYLRAYVLTCLKLLCAYVLTSLTCLWALRAYVPLWLNYYVPTCLSALGFYVCTGLRALIFHEPSWFYFSRATFLRAFIYIFSCLRSSEA